MTINFIDFLKNQVYNATPETIKLSKGNITKAVDVIRRHQDELKAQLTIETMKKFQASTNTKKEVTNG